MLKHWLATAAVFAMTGAAFAQGPTVDTTISTQSTTVPPVGSYSTTKTQRTTDAFGNTTEQSQTYKSGSGGASTRVETQVKRSDGSAESSYREQWSSSPGVVTTVPGTVTTLTPSLGSTLVVPNGSVTTVNPDGSLTTTTRTTTLGR